VTDFPFLLLMIAVPAIGAAVVAALPKGRDLLAKQISLGVSLVVLLLAVLATVAFDTDGDRFQSPGVPTSASSSRSAWTASPW
jgi:NADH-quinone oxidoreductase subunit M